MSSMISSVDNPPHPMPQQPRQLLPRQAYIEQSWFDRERSALFENSWSYVGVTADLPKRGDYITVDVGDHRLFVIRDTADTLRGFHNICRHRGTELLEGTGKVESARIVCPYHRWTYNLDGSLRAVPMKQKCFPNLDLDRHHLFQAAVGEFKGLVFAHPDPNADFSSWLADLESVVWPHELGQMVASPEVTYKMMCNWKVFFENAVDGYHLAYLHDQTLGGPKADLNVWAVHGRHLVWYSTETGKRTCLPEAVAQQLNSSGAKPISGAESGEYAGVYMLFPSTIVTAGPTEFTISNLRPVSPDATLLTARQWTSKDNGFRWLRGDDAAVKNYPGYDPDTGYLKLERLKQHPLETGDFHWEDVWVCEKLQRSMHSPRYKIGELAKGSGAEAPIEFFQRNVLNYISNGDSV